MGKIEPTPEQRKQLCEALVGAFNAAELTQLVAFNLPHRLDMLVNPAASTSTLVFELVEALDRRNELEPLLRGAIGARPNDERLTAIIRAIAPAVFTPVDTAKLVVQVTDGLGVLAGSAGDPLVWGKVGEFQAIFRGVVAKTKVLAGYKGLHDGLHNLQMRMPSVEVAAAAFATDAPMGRLIAREVINLKEQARRSSELAVGLPTRSLEQMWIDDLGQAAEDIGTALRAKDQPGMVRSVTVLRQLLQEAYRIDGQMASGAADLQLGLLIDALGEVAKRLTQADVVAAVSSALDALVVIRPRLEGLVVEHSEWQWLNKALAGIDSNPGIRPEEKVFGWPKVKKRILALCQAFSAAPWAIELLALTDKWEKAAEAGQGTESEEAAVEVYATASNHFFEVDLDLLQLSGQLTEIGVPIKTLLGSTVHDVA